MISEVVLSRIDKELSRKFLNYLEKIKMDRMVRNALNKSYNYRKVYISVIEDQILVAIELLSMIDTHLNE